MSSLLDDRSYGMGWDDGYQRGRDRGYADGWQDCSRGYEERVAKLSAEMKLMEARISVLTRRIDDADKGHS